MIATVTSNERITEQETERIMKNMPLYAKYGYEIVKAIHDKDGILITFKNEQARDFWFLFEADKTQFTFIGFPVFNPITSRVF